MDVQILFVILQYIIPMPNIDFFKTFFTMHKKLEKNLRYDKLGIPRMHCD